VVVVGGIPAAKTLGLVAGYGLRQYNRKQRLGFQL
jgi:hypothetical protein